MNMEKCKFQIGITEGQLIEHQNKIHFTIYPNDIVSTWKTQFASAKIYWTDFLPVLWIICHVF